MELTNGLKEIIQQSFLYAKDAGFEYITPEVMLRVICEKDEFIEAFINCGGNIEMLVSDLDNYADEYIEKVEEASPEFSFGCNYMISYAERSAINSGRNYIGLTHLLHGMWNLSDSYAVYFIEKQDITEADILRELADTDETAVGTAPESAKPEARPDESWRQYAPCLNDTLKDVNPLIGREAEIKRTIQILCRKEKNNPLHIGEPGVGKTAITYGLVRRIVEGDVPEAIKGARVFALDLFSMLAGAQYRGDFEKRFKKVLTEISKEEKPIVFIDEIHTIAGAGAVGEGAFDASNMLKPYLADGHIRFIGATTYDEYKKHFEKNKSLVRRFINVDINEPSEDETVEILKGVKKNYEDFHGVSYKKGILEYMVSMSKKHVHERFLPDKAIDIMDEAGSYRKLNPVADNKKQTVDKDVINEVLTGICRVPIETVATDDAEGLATLESRIKARIFGQDEAVSQVVNAIKFSKAGLLEDNKPLASLLFVGPTGVGKTEIAKSLAEEMGVKLIRFDMSEYTERHTVAKLIGSPAGYVGYEEGGILTEEIRKNPSAVLLLDEIEKAHADIYNVLLSVMDYATLTDNQGRKADFSNVVVIMTSNAGASRLGKKDIGFEGASQDSSAIMEEVKHTFMPEFRNRLNRIVVFNGMNDDMAYQIVDKKMSELSDMLLKKNIKLSVDKEAKELIKKRGISTEFGAREVDRVIRNDIKPLFVDEILFGKLKKGGVISLSVKDGEFSAVPE
ncbi:MAG: ATP-dependent Clp protease ATP-binding subunit [Lachnospiraceae bacterium]|nr:ATP-dependent Clp protease ATP-binding subunit [Lachnospiraceae bacterium]